MKRFVAMIACLMLAACNPATATADLDASEKAIGAFHTKMNAGDFDDIYYESADEMQASAEILEFEGLLGAVQKKLGKAGKSTRMGWRINYLNGGSFAVLTMETAYEKGKAMETFTYKSSPKGPLLVGYNIQSNALIVN
jgi:hypothetical protein